MELGNKDFSVYFSVSDGKGGANISIWFAVCTMCTCEFTPGQVLLKIYHLFVGYVLHHW